MKSLLFLLMLVLQLRAASVRVLWSANPERDVVGYVLEYGGPPPLSPVTIESSSPTLVVTSLLPGVAYNFRVRAKNSTGLLGEWSPAAVYQPPAAEPTLPAGVEEVRQGELVVDEWEWSTDLENWTPFLRVSIPVPMTLPSGEPVERLFLRRRRR